MTALEMCVRHPAATPLDQPESCDTSTGRHLDDCPTPGGWLIRDWTQPGVAKSRHCTEHAADYLLEIPLCGPAECGANGLPCAHPLLDHDGTQYNR